MHRAIVAKPFQRLWGFYERQLQKRPLLTQMTTSALLWGAGDYMAQHIENKRKTDHRRAALTALFGAMVIGPLGHYWYHELDRCANM